MCCGTLSAQTTYGQTSSGVEMKKKKFREKSDRKSGFIHRLDMGVSFGTDEWQTMDVDVAYIYGYQAGRAFFFGVGGGLQVQPVFYDYYLSQKYKLDRPFSVSVPLFVEIKSYIMNRKVSPFIDFRGGYSFGLLDSKLTSSRETEYGTYNTDNLSNRIDSYTKNWEATGKFAAAGVGLSFKKWDVGVYKFYQYGNYKYETEIERHYNDGSVTTVSEQGKKTNRHIPVDIQLRASYKF